MQNKIVVALPSNVDYEHCLNFLNRSNEESAHWVDDHTGALYKFIRLDREIWEIRIDYLPHQLEITVLSPRSDEIPTGKIVQFVKEWFDLERDLFDFYVLVKENPFLKNSILKFRGLRLIGIPDLFEALCWAILGQQINLTFAYKLKRNLILAAENSQALAPESVHFSSITYLPFPQPEAVLSLSIAQMRQLQISQRKAEYILNIAKLCAEGLLTKEILIQLADPAAIHNYLIGIRGIGPWTAEYVKLKSLGISSAFPIQDAGLINALKYHLNLTKRPTIKEIRKLAESWKGWEGYVTIYLWHSLQYLKK